MPLDSAAGGHCFERTDKARMSQYGTQADPSKVWGLVGDAGGVTPLISPPSSAQKPLASPYNGLGEYRLVNGNNPNPNNHLANHWSGIRLPTAPSGGPTHPQWEHYRSGAVSTANTAYLRSPTSLGASSGQIGAHQGWYPASAIPHNKLPHRPNPSFPSPTMQEDQQQPQHPSSAYHSPFSSAGDMALLAARANPQHNNSVTSVPAQSQVYLPSSQSVPSVSATSPLGEFLPPPSRVNVYPSRLELDMLRSLQSSQPQSIPAPHGQASPLQPRQFWSPPAQRLPSMSGAFSPLNGAAGTTQIKHEIPFSPPQISTHEAVHSTTEGLLAVRQPTEEPFATGNNQMQTEDERSRCGQPSNGLSSPRVSNSAQEVTTSVPTTTQPSPQYQEISPAGAESRGREGAAEEESSVSSVTESVVPVSSTQVSTEPQDSPSCLPDETELASDRLYPQSSGNRANISCAEQAQNRPHSPSPQQAHTLTSNQMDHTGAETSTQEQETTGQAEDQAGIRAKVEKEEAEGEECETEFDPSFPPTKSPKPESRSDSTSGLILDDDEVNGKPLVVDTEMHEPITPEELSPDPEVSNQSASSLMASLGFNASETNRRAALILEQKIQHESGPVGFIPSVTSVTRPPGLRPPLGFPLISPSQPLSSNSTLRISPATTSGQSTYTCPICGFTSTSKFHFNSHMNTHTDHQCSMCDYTARTEGRLKRHMKEFHSPAEQLAAGVTPSGELVDPLPQSSQSATPSALEQMQQALARSQEAFAQHTSSQSAGSGSDAGTPPKDGDRKQSTSHKPKHYRCKQCTHLSMSKEESWQHARSHIKPDKLLTCPQCEFVTEYKHHLEYHLRNHFGSKPFRCNKCNYSCVNKSMLNSHMKSHSSYYQFRCRDCTYATKYCHSLKLHLRKYGHHPQNIDLPDGTSLDPSTMDSMVPPRRGPRPKTSDSASPPFVSPLSVSAASRMPQPSPINPAAPSVLQGMSSLVPPNLLEALRFQQISGAAAMAKSIATLGAQLPTIQGDSGASSGRTPSDSGASGDSSGSQKCNMCGYRSTSQQDYVQHVFMHNLESANFYKHAATTAAAAALLSQGNSATASTNREEEGSEEHSPSVQGRNSPSHEGSQGSSGSPISGSKGSGDEGSNGTPGEVPTGSSSRRKGKAYKLDRIALRLQGRMSPAPSSGGQEDPEVMDVQAQDQEESGEQSEVGMETVESVVSSVIQNQPQSVMPRYTTAEEVRNQPLQVAFEALKSAVEKQQSENGGNQKGASCSDESGEGKCGSKPDWGSAFVCDHCQVAFMNAVMYHIHMGYHGYDNPFRCNRCGQLCQDSLGMFMHIAQAKH